MGRGGKCRCPISRFAAARRLPNDAGAMMLADRLRVLLDLQVSSAFWTINIFQIILDGPGLMTILKTIGFQLERDAQTEWGASHGTT
jgi:hypothetical protein